MKTLIAAVVMVAAVSVQAQEAKLGAGVTLKESTSIVTLMAHPEMFVGKTVRVDGVARDVCTEMGCWIAIAADDKADSPIVRIKVEDGVIVFPVTAKGKKVSAEGVFEVAKAEEHKEGADHAAHQQQASSKEPAKYQIKGTGAIIKG